MTALVPLRAASAGGSGSFLVRADDGERYWCKTLNNLQGPRVPITEQIVGRLGRLIGAAVCSVSLVRIPVDLAGWEFRPGARLEVGWAHGSLAVEPALETRTLDHRAGDDNSRRHATLFALYDWLAGQDPQWLVLDQADFAYYSHDHGHYLPAGPNWTISTLRNQRDDAYKLPADSRGLDQLELVRVAERLEGLRSEEMLEELQTLPAEWPVTDDEIDEIVQFADHRRALVASRLRTLASA